VAVKFRDYYEVLGVARTATADEIKRAYRKLARKRHPDLQPAGERAKASQAFQEINEAYEVLSDPEKRKRYDALGQHWKSGMDFTPPPGADGGAAGGGAAQWEDLEGFSDFFASIFGRPPRGARGGAGTGSFRIEMPGADVEAELPVTIEDLLHGGRRRITLGRGRTVDVEIPVGVRDATVLRLAGQGEKGMGSAPAGDLFLHLRLTPHPRYRVVAADDLEMDLPLWPWQAVLGSKVRIDTPEGAVALTIPAGTPASRRLRLRSRGLPRSDGARGDLYAVVRIVVPEQPSAAEREAYETLMRSSGRPLDRPADG
jgi:curved DNA-binding protein